MKEREERKNGGSCLWAEKKALRLRRQLVGCLFDPLGQTEEGWRKEITGEKDGGLLRGPFSVIYRTNRWHIVFTLAFLNLQ